MATRAMLRASDADRDAVVERLRAAAAEGRLDTEELDERVHAALRARTYGQLDGLVADLPGARGPRRPRPRGVIATTQATLSVVLPVLVALAVVAAVLTAVAIAAAWWVLWVLVGLAMCRRGCSPRRLAAGPPRRRAVAARW